MTSKDGTRPRRTRRDDAGRAPPAGALSRIVEIDLVPEDGLKLSIEADASERAAIARRAGLIAIEWLQADLEIVKEGEARLRVVGPLEARVTQTCVVSLEPFESELHAAIEAEYAVAPRPAPSRRGRAAQGAAQAAAPVEEPSQSFAARLDAPEPIVDGRIDVGALAEEFLVLSLDPYPRKPGVRFEGAAFSASPDAPESPFAALKKLKGED